MMRLALIARLLLLIAAILQPINAPGATPKICIPDVLNVPGTTGAPDWWTAGQVTAEAPPRPNNLAYQPSDPRWGGAMSLDYGSGSISTVEYRALFNQSSGKTFIGLSWQVKSTAQFGIDQTRLYAGFYSPAANKGTLITVTLKNTATGVDVNFPVPTPRARSASEVSGGVPYYEATLTTGTGTNPATWISPVGTPSWLSETLRVWINAQTNPYSWTVQLRVPVNASIADGVDVQPASFRMWHYAQVETLLSATSPPAIVPYTWPRPDPGQPALTFASFQQGIQQKFPDTGVWGEFALVPDPKTDSTCKGIFLANDRIGTRLTSFNSEIKLFAANTFFAEPENRSADPVATNALSATFRIANWGSQPEDIVAAWTAPTALQNLVASALPPPNNANSALAGGFAKIEGDWNPSLKDEDICPFIGRSGLPATPTQPAVSGRASCPNLAFTRGLHQCILVKLQGPSQNFLRDSASRNMNFVRASRFEREAEISVVGLPSLPAGKRDVFMYTERRNMPRNVQSDLAAYARGLRVRDDMGAAAVGQRGSDEFLAATTPTWVVHSYHDTGEKIMLSGREYPVLQPQTAFGYFVSHKGALQGWSDVIEGADRIREDLYKVSPANDGVVRVKTIVQAVEPGESPVGMPWPPATTSNRYALWLALGSTFPHGSFGNQHKSGLAANLGFEYIFTPAISVEATLGRHSFGGQNGGNDIDVTQFGINGKLYFAQPSFKPFVTAGVSGYAFDPGSTRFGVNLGAGVQVDLTPQWSLEGRYTRHQVRGNSPNSSYSTLQLGLRYAF